MKTQDIENDLRLNYLEFLESGNDELIKQRYNSAVNSFFKAVAVLCDLNIYIKIRILPKNHSDRFNLLRQNFPQVYQIVSDLFKRYTDSYNLRMDKEDVIYLKQNAEKLKKIFGT